MGAVVIKPANGEVGHITGFGQNIYKELTVKVQWVTDSLTFERTSFIHPSNIIVL
jgi:hypothetical protein